METAVRACEAAKVRVRWCEGASSSAALVVTINAGVCLMLGIARTAWTKWMPLSVANVTDTSEVLGLIGEQGGRFSRMPKQPPGMPCDTDLITLNRAATVARLLAGAAHEVNNALQVVGGTTELLQSAPGLPDPVADGLRRITVQTVRAASAIQEVMLFARQRKDGQAATVNLREIAARSAALRSFAIARARLSIAVDASPTGRYTVNGSPMLLQLAVLNLIVNAEQALAGRQGGAIRVELEESPGAVVLRVADNGAGVDAAAGDRIFETFFTTRSRDEASGLGLPVARHVAEQHGGTLTLEPREAGACFSMRLPAAL